MGLNMSFRLLRNGLLVALIHGNFTFTASTHAQGTRLPSLGFIRDVEYDQTSNSLVVGGDNGFYVWKPGSGEEPNRIGTQGIAGLAISHGGDQLIYGGGITPTRWVTLPDNEQVRPLEYDTRQGMDFEFSADGKTLLALEWRAIDFESIRPTVVLLDTSDGSEIRRYPEVDTFSVFPWEATLSPESNFLAVTYGSFQGGRIHIYDNRNGERVVDARFRQGQGWDLIQFSDDGRFAAFLGEGAIRVYATETWEMSEFETPNSARGFDLSPSGDLLATGDGRIVRHRTGETVFDIRNHGVPDPLIQAVRISPNGEFLLTMRPISNELEVWEIETGTKVLTRPAGELFNERQFYGDFLPDNSGVVYSTSGNSFGTALLDGTPGEAEETFVALGEVAYLRFTESDEAVELIDLDRTNNAKPTVRSLDIESDDFTTVRSPTLFESAAYSPNGRWLGIINKNGQERLQVWDRGQGDPVVSHPASFSGFVEAFALADDGQTAAIGINGGRVFLWSGSSRRSTITLPNRSFVRGLAFAPESNRLAAMTSEGWVYVLDTDTREVLAERKVKSEWQFHLVPRFSPDGNWLAINGEDFSYVWDWQNDRTLLSFPTRISTRSFAFSPDQRFLAIGFYTEVEVYQIQSRNRLARFRFEEFTEGVSAVAFSNDQNTLVAGTGVGNLQFWSLADRLPPAPLPRLNVSHQDPGTVSLDWTVNPNQPLTLETSPDLMNWSPLPTNEPGQAQVDTGTPAQFFRLAPAQNQ